MVLVVIITEDMMLVAGLNNSLYRSISNVVWGETWIFGIYKCNLSVSDINSGGYNEHKVSHVDLSERDTNSVGVGFGLDDGEVSVVWALLHRN